MEKKIPMRMCIVCKKMIPKHDLIRVVKTNEGIVSLDFTGKASGRGAYICNDIESMQKCVKSKALSRAYKENIPQDVYDKILGEYIEQHKN